MKVQFYTAVSLDGFLATENDSLDWLFALGNVDGSTYPEFIAQVGALAMGASTYEWMLAHSEEVKAEAGSPWPYQQLTCIFTHRTLAPVEGANIRFVRDDVRPVFEQLRIAAGGKNVWIVGGGDLAGQFYDAGLLDEVIVQIAPVTLGKGKPLFPRQMKSPGLTLQNVHSMGAGMVELRYSVNK